MIYRTSALMVIVIHAVLYIIGVVCQVILQPVRQRKFLYPPCGFINGNTTQMLQRRCGCVHRSREQQLHRAVGWGERGSPALTRRPGQLHVVLHKMDDAVELLEFGLDQHHGVQLELAVLVFDTQVGWSRRCHGGDGEEVVPLRAVPDQKCALRRVLQDLLGFIGCQAAPIPACFQEKKTHRWSYVSSSTVFVSVVCLCNMRPITFPSKDTLTKP